MAAFDDIQGLFARILAENDEPAPQLGISRADVARQLVDIGIPAHPLLLDLYSWHNGIHHVDAFLHFLPLEEAISTYKQRREYDETWESSWFPALTINGDLWISLDTKTDRLLLDDTEDGKRWILANHFQDYIDALRYAFESGVAQFDPKSGSFEIGEDAWTAIARRHRVSDW